MTRIFFATTGIFTTKTVMEVYWDTGIQAHIPSSTQSTGEVSEDYVSLAGISKNGDSNIDGGWYQIDESGFIAGPQIGLENQTSFPLSKYNHAFCVKDGALYFGSGSSWIPVVSGVEGGFSQHGNEMHDPDFTTQSDFETHTASSSAHHVKYLDSEAVNAMGTKDDSNSLNHDKYTDDQALMASTGYAETLSGIYQLSGVIQMDYDYVDDAFDNATGYSETLSGIYQLSGTVSMDYDYVDDAFDNATGYSETLSGIYAVSGHSHYLTGLLDVELSGAVHGQVLTLSGSTWIPEDGGGGELNDLSDVNISGMVEGDVLRYSGTEWYNHPFSEYSGFIIDGGDSSTEYTGTVRIIDGSNGEFDNLSANETFTLSSTVVSGIETTLTDDSTKIPTSSAVVDATSWIGVDKSSYDYVLTDLITDGNWHDLDLYSDGFLPTQEQYMVVLNVFVKDDAVNNLLYFRTNGDVNSAHAQWINTIVADIYSTRSIIILTDSNGVLEYNATNTTWTSIYITVTLYRKNV